MNVMRSAPEPLTIGDLVALIRRRAGIALAAGAFGVLLVLAVALAVPPKFRADAALTLNREEKAIEFTVAPPPPADLLNTQRELIQSRAVLDQAIRLGGLDGNPVYARATDQLAVISKRFRASVARNASVLEIDLLDEDAQRAERGLQAIIDAYQAERTRDVRTRSERDLRQLEEQVATARQRLDASRAAESSFRTARGIAGTDPERNHIVERLTGIAARQADIDAKLAASDALLEQVRAIDRLSAGEERRNAYLRIDQISTLTVIGQILTQLNQLQGDESVLAQKYGDRHPRLLEARKHLDAKREQLDLAIAQGKAGIESENQALLAQRANLASAVALQREQLNRYRVDLVQLATLSAESREREKLTQELSTRLAQRQILAQFTDQPLILVSPPVAAPVPDGLGFGAYAGLALVIASAAALVAAVVTDAVDRRLRDQAAVRRIASLPVLAHVPWLPGLRSLVETGSSEPAALAEAFRTVRVGLRLLSGVPRVITVLSSDQSDGRTTAATRLAASFAAAGFRTLLADADLRHPQAAQQFGIAAPVGLADLLAGEPDLAPMATGVANLDLLPAGTSVPNAGELLASHCLPEWIAHIRSFYDVVVLDTPPLDSVADGLQALEVCDHAVIVIRHGRTHADHLTRLLAQAEPHRARLAGLILIDFPTSRSHA